METENKLVRRIKLGDKAVLESVYIQHKAEFLLFAARFSMSSEDALDVYQDTVVAFYENIVSGKLVKLSSSLKTYLFAIGKYQIYNRLNIKISSEDIVKYENFFKDNGKNDILFEEDQVKKLQKAYSGLGKKCQQLLKLFYYKNLSLEEIQVSLKYASKDVAKSQKSRCLKQLKELMLKD